MSSGFLPREATSSPPTTSIPALEGSPHPKVPARQFAFFQERSSLLPRRYGVAGADFLAAKWVRSHTTALFRQINKDNPHTHHDALEFPDGQIVLLTDLFEDQEATVLQLPAQPATAAEAAAQERVALVG